MKTTTLFSTQSRRGFTITEVMISMSITALLTGLLLTTFTRGLKTMYKDNQRLLTNATLRNFTANVARETVDSTEFYVFPSYESLDGSVNFTTDVSTLAADSFDTYLAEGNCLLLVTRTSLSDAAKVRQLKIYYLVKKPGDSSSLPYPVRYYESPDYGDDSTRELQALVDAINLKTTPVYPSTRVMATNARGRAYPNSTTNFHPIFSTESATTTPTNESVSINVEIINGTTANNMLSSSSFNYTISPRR